MSGEKPVCVIDCREMTGREEAHRCLAEKLSFPGWYGKNLDALYDMLTSTPPLRLVFICSEALEQLGPYGARLRETVLDAAKASPVLEAEFVQGPAPAEDP